jgi:membrane protease YdiL (CAAX protease family)
LCASAWGEYAAWALAQQYLLQAFVLRRFRQAGLPQTRACAMAAGLFSLLHAPNWLLVGLTAGMGTLWCRLFLRRPNILTLGLSHVTLSLLVYYAWPVSWLGNLTIGPMYLRWAGMQ